MTSSSNDMSQKSLPIWSIKRALSFAIRVLIKLHNKLFNSQARTLNNQLYEDVLSISKEEMARFEEQLHQFSNDRLYGKDYEHEFVTHRYRLYLSLKWLEDAIVGYSTRANASRLDGVEMGGMTIVTDLLAQTFPQVNWQNTSGDVRYTWDNPNDSADLIVSMEVLEHLTDLPDGINNGFYATGLKAALRESLRVLKAGGILFITTPNAASTFNLNKALAGIPAWFYPPHVREYTLAELKAFLEEIGFKIQRAQAVQCLTVDYKLDYTSLFQTMLGSLVSANINDRGDDLFIIAVK